MALFIINVMDFPIIQVLFSLLAVVNIKLVGFEEGILYVPENQEEGKIEVELTEAVNSVEVSQCFL